MKKHQLLKIDIERYYIAKANYELANAKGAITYTQT